MVEVDYPHGDSTWPDTQDVIEKYWGTSPPDELRAMCSENAAASTATRCPTPSCPGIRRPMDFTPTAEKLIPDLSPREELVVLARALWREGYNDHLAGHITVNLGDGTLLCNPWLLTWAELRPSQVLRIDLDGRVVEGDWPVPLGIPLHLELHKLRPTSPGPCTTTPSTARCGPTWARCPPSSTRARPSAAGAGPGQRVRGPSTTRPAPGGRWSRWATASMALLAGHGVFVLGGSARAVHQRAVALEQRCQHAWHVRVAGSGANAPAPPVLPRPWRPATARASSASGRRPCGPSWRADPICCGGRSRRRRGAGPGRRR
jgi:L-ribulose-5-phosphate 4-epimerase